MPILPLPSPPLNQIWLPPPPEPSRKLQAVRFSTLTPLALKTSTPLRPSGFLFLPRGPRSCRRGLLGQRFGPGFVPSTNTALRFIPRRWMRDFVM